MYDVGGKIFWKGCQLSRILQIPNYFFPNIGGIEQTARDILHVIQETSYEQKIICFNENAKKEDYVCKRAETVKDIVDDVEVIRCGCVAKVASQSLSLTYPRELYKVIKEFRPDIILFHYPNPFVASFLLPMIPKETKLILYWHLDITKQKILGKIFHNQTLRLIRRANQIVATSPNYVEGSPYLSKNQDKIVVIPSCIDTTRLKPSQSHYERAKEIREEHKGKFICFAIGRHVEYKGMEYLVKAAKLLNGAYAVLIGGQGPLTQSLMEMAKDDRKVYFIGKISDDELIANYLACDVICFPSITKNEAFGLSLAEGMYFGKPAVTFNIPGSGVNYVNIDRKTGIEVENKNVRKYSESIKKLGNNNKLVDFYGKNAKKRVISLFLYDSFSDVIKDLINKK